MAEHRAPSTSRQIRVQRFVDEYVVDCNSTRAAKAVGWSPTTGAKLVQDPMVRALIDAKLKAVAGLLDLNAQRVLEMLMRVYQGAVEDRSWSVAKGAVELFGKHLGMFADKHEIDFGISLSQLINGSPKMEELTSGAVVDAVLEAPLLLEQSPSIEEMEKLDAKQMQSEPVTSETTTQDEIEYGEPDVAAPTTVVVDPSP